MDERTEDKLAARSPRADINATTILNASQLYREAPVGAPGILRSLRELIDSYSTVRILQEQSIITMQASVLQIS